MSLQEDSLGFVLADVSRLLRQCFQKQLVGSSLTLAQAKALVTVYRQQGLRQVELAELMEIQPITLTRLIDQLVNDGVVERRLDPTDRRAYRLYLTPAAAPHLAAIEQVADIVQPIACQGLDENESTVLLSALRKMRDNLTSQ
jgi:DNA-binding MarR family transcriptional regulator